MDTIKKRVQKHPKLLKVRKPNRHAMIRLIKAVMSFLEVTETNKPIKEWKELANAVAPYLRVADELGEKIR